MSLLRRIGFDRPIQMEWLDETVRLYSENKNVDEIKDLLNNYLEKDINGRENRRKTINILMRTWVNVEDEHKAVREEALEIFNETSEKGKLALNWCMLTLAYPIFFDICTVIGNLFELSNEFSSSMIKRRIFEKWGERSTLEYAIGKIISSIRDWGIIEQGDKRGVYKRNNKIDCIDKDIQVLFLKIYLISSQKNCIDYANIEHIPALFPFDIDIRLRDIQKNNQFKINNMGGNLMIGL